MIEPCVSGRRTCVLDSKDDREETIFTLPKLIESKDGIIRRLGEFLSKIHRQYNVNNKVVIEKV